MMKSVKAIGTSTKGVIYLGGLLKPEERRGTDVLNGIAYDKAGDRIFVTG